MKVLLSGNEAIARGAWEAGCTVACAYPGTPSTEILENIAKYKEIYAEWSTNEKVAFDVASGASFAGARALVAMKHVGLNVAADTFFTMSYSGVTGGLVVISADDPGMWSSQNEQDNRWYALAAKVPMLEPSDSQEAKDFARIGFEISEKFDTPVLIRLTTRICHSKTLVKLGERREHRPTGYKKDSQKRLFLPVNARIRHTIIEKRLKELKKYSEKFPGNQIESVKSQTGIITSAIAYQYAKEIFPNASFLKLSMTYPTPEKLIKKFASQVNKLYVIEEGDPFLENEIKMLGIKVIGKEKIPVCGELNQFIVREAIKPSSHQATKHQIPKPPPRPPVLCPGCSHRGVFYVINQLKLHVTGDIGCYTLGALPPLNAMDTCICMGASIGHAHGLEIALKDKIKGKVVAVIGDSTFFHAGIPTLINVVYNKGISTIIVLDNQTTAMTGHQAHPGTGKTLKGEKARIVKIEEVAKGCGINHVYIVDPYDLKATKELIKREVKREEPSVIIARHPCALRVKPEPPLKVIPDKCTGCMLCIRLGCPAITMRDDKAWIDLLLCDGCGMCKQVCVKNAIK
ncbi:indolepyruvate ferredoxin oxidoreductase subunit alpha [candidate division WOR-3 bacterium]|nr:indolepyruvate ferredoxin oxidoreductase subunit alpha [candidate division WOR-3 bacterium]